MKSLPKRLLKFSLVLAAIVVPEVGVALPAAYADSSASSSAGSEASLEAPSPGRGRRRGGRRAYWRRQNAQANKAARKEEEAQRARSWTGDNAWKGDHH